MRPLFRTACSLVSLVSAALLVVQPVTAKPAPAPTAEAGSADPWLYRGSDVPRDKEWTFGELPNGLRYAVRKNGVPPGQVSIRVRIDAGSLYENDNERGFAHLLEHMVFRQSRYLADGAAIPAFQRLGATFGSDTNAETSPVSTTFKLDLPNATAASLDESFKLVSGMMIAPTLSEANVRTDVPIVLAEKRERGGLAERLADATQQTLFAGQRMAVRPVIGTTETLEAANQASVRAFHARWYRPDNAVIIAVGDADPAQLAALIEKYFGEWKAVGKLTPAPSFGDPVATAGSSAGHVGETRVVVEPDVPRGLTYAVMRPWRKVDDTIVYNQGIMVDALAQAIINRRLEARARGGGSYLVAQVNQEKVSRSADATFVSVTPLGENWKTALDDVRAVIADAMAAAPTQEEIDREVAEMNVAFESSVEQRRLQPGSRLADDIVTALDIRETVASPETVLQIFNQSRPLFTPQAVLDHTRALFQGTVTRGVYVTPKAGEGDAASLKMALAAPVKADSKARLDSKPISFAELPPIGTPGKVVTSSPTSVLEIEQVELSNGTKVLLWPTTDEPGRVTVKVRWGAGYRAFQAGDAAYIALGDTALVGSGVGTLGQEELDRISTGRKMGFDFAIEDAAFQLSANTRNADLADQLYLFAAKLSMPRWDVNPVLRAKAAAKLQYESFATSPQGVMQRDLAFLQHGRDARFRTPTPQDIDAATPDGFRKVWEPVLREGPIEVQLFGDFNRADAIAALEKTFGALPRRAPLPQALLRSSFADLAPTAQPIVLEHRGDPGQAAAVINWPTAGGIAQITEGRQLEILSQLFSNRLLDAMREKLGASYSPYVANSWPQDLDKGGAIFALAQLQPKAVPVFFATADEIAAELIAAPPSADELSRVTEPLKQQLTRAYTSSAFFMNQLEGASDDPRKFAALRSLLPDMTQTTPAAMQALAAKYLKPGNSWRVAVIPAGQKLATDLPKGMTMPGAGR
ncbi:M16 family metallopeptidase [Novosphingobium aquiterrae]|uniref:M16 family metallopeptidase n=1 Tax=Novosphingobium aquiterrae TaxID=624388 RepID=A0ABV6PL66_9SPHN